MNSLLLPEENCPYHLDLPDPSHPPHYWGYVNGVPVGYVSHYWCDGTAHA